MPNNTETYWDADGQSLHTYARSIETIGGMGPAPFRGEDITVPLQSGQMFVPKTLDSNVITLAMWLRGIDQNAGPGASKATKAKYQENYNDLIRLLYQPGRLVNLRKRFYDSGGSLVPAVAGVQYVGGLEPNMIGRTASRCTVDLKVLDGVFYDDRPGGVSTLVNGMNNVIVYGNTETTNIEVTISGARNAISITNTSLGVGFTHPRSLASGTQTKIKVREFDSMETTGGTSLDTSSAITHFGAAQWLVLKPGLNQVRLDSTFGTGTVTLSVKGAWV